MIIEHGSQSRESVTNTDKLADVPADLLEAAETFRQVAVKYKRQFFLCVNCDDNKSGQAYTFWSFISEHMTQKEVSIDVKKGNLRPLNSEEFHAFYTMIAQALRGVSSGKATVAFLAPPEEEKPNDVP